MKKFLFSLGAAGAALALAPAANAAPTITIVSNPAGASGSFGNAAVTCPADVTAPCSFTDTLTFTTPSNSLDPSGTTNMAAGSIASIAIALDSMINFSSVTLNGASFVLGTAMSGGLPVLDFNGNPVQTGFLAGVVLDPGATNTLQINGTTTGTGSYGGNLTFTYNAAVPEPATWALMLLGFGVIGYSMRRRSAGQLAQAI